MTACAGLKKDLERAAMLSRKVHNIAKQGMTGALQALGAAHFPQVAPNNWTTFRTLNVSMHANCKADSMRSMTDYNGYGKSLSSGCPTLKRGYWRAFGSGAGIRRYSQLSGAPTDLDRRGASRKLKRFQEYLNRSSDDGVTQLLSHIDHEVALIEERLEALNDTMRRVDFQSGRYLCLIAKPVVHDSMRTLLRAQRQLNSARFVDDDGESQYKALQALVGLLKDACERNRTQGARALLDPRFRLEFAVSVIERKPGASLRLVPVHKAVVVEKKKSSRLMY